eukprot:2120892-Amphidinium_carterae.1
MFDCKFTERKGTVNKTTEDCMLHFENTDDQVRQKSFKWRNKVLKQDLTCVISLLEAQTLGNCFVAELQKASRQHAISPLLIVLLRLLQAPYTGCCARLGTGALQNPLDALKH